jgi:two-component system, OmpR family, sensor histidine kinase KdpD
LPDFGFPLLLLAGGIVLAMGMAETRNWSDQSAALLRAAGVAVLTMTVAVLVGIELEKWVSTRGISLIFIAAVVLCAARMGIAAGILSAVAAFLSLNFFFIEPRHTFAIADQKELFSLGIFLAVAAITGSLAGRLREQAVRASRRADMLQLLSDFSARISSAARDVEILAALTEQASKAIEGPVVLFRQDGEFPAVESAFPNGLTIDLHETQGAEQVLRKGHPLTATAPGWAGGRFEYRFVDKDRLPDRVIALAPKGGHTAMTTDAEQVVATLMEQASLAAERLRFSKASEAAQAAAHEEKLRSTLLSSVSHDLRTPLAAILGSVTTLRQFGGTMPAAAQSELLAAIEDETRRLTRQVANLLDMTKLQSGLKLRKDWADMREIVQTSVAAMQVSAPGLVFEQRLDAGLPPLKCDAALLGQVFYNLLENAAKFSPPASPVLICGAALAGGVEIKVIDQGAGIDADDLPFVFDKFFSRAPGPAGKEGAGLGLAIAKAIVEEMGGAIRAVSPGGSGIGTEITVTLPVGDVQSAEAQ